MIEREKETEREREREGARERARERGSEGAREGEGEKYKNMFHTAVLNQTSIDRYGYNLNVYIKNLWVCLCEKVCPCPKSTPVIGL